MIKLYNSLTKQLEELKPSGSTLNMFVCGPTVYDYIHVGNARTFVAFDVIAKHIRYRGYDLFYLQNITDIEDKIIKRAQEENVDVETIADRYDQVYRADAHALGITSVSQYAKATDYIPAIIKQVQTLIDKGFAYEIDDGIYFDLAKFPEYGKLSGRTTVQEHDGVSRIDENEQKRNSGDFCLWKRSKPEEPIWQAPWFPGRPGWHIEDTAITETFFGPQYDIHGGARDLMFPHHEAEITQQEAASGKSPFVRYWMHAGFLEMSATKMSKSLGNFARVRDILAQYSPETLRFFFLSSHYRASLEFSDQGLLQAEAAMNRISETLERLRFFEDKNPLAHGIDQEVATTIHEIHEKALAAMDNDFNAPETIGHLFDLLKLVNQYIDAEKLDLHSVKKILHVLDFYHSVLGIIPSHPPQTLPEEVQKLVHERHAAKESKEYTKADSLRGELVQLGYSVDDTKYGPLVKKIRK